MSKFIAYIYVYIYMHIYTYAYIFRHTYFIHIYLNICRVPAEQVATFTLNCESCSFHPLVVKEVFASLLQE